MKYETLKSGCVYHIFNQGNNKEVLFKELRNYNYFLKLVAKHILPVAEIYAYCLLPNHFHFAIRIKDDIIPKKISQAFSNLFNAYAKSINRAYKRTGSLFKRKFARIRVKDEDYLKNLILYIHTNAEHHGIIHDFKLYKHSSYNAYISSKHTQISKDYIIGLFDSIENFKKCHNDKSVILNENPSKD